MEQLVNRTVVLGLFDSYKDVDRAIQTLKFELDTEAEFSVKMSEQGPSPGLPHTRQTHAPQGALWGGAIGVIVSGFFVLLIAVDALVIPGLQSMTLAGLMMTAIMGLLFGAAIGALGGTLVGIGVPGKKVDLPHSKQRKMVLTVLAHSNAEALKIKSIGQNIMSGNF